MAVGKNKMDEEIQQFSQIITDAFTNIRLSDVKNANSLVGTWKKILYRIKSNSNPNEGKNLAAHSRVVDLKNGILFIEADHSGWISLLRLHRKFILGGLHRELPQLEIHTIAYKLKGNEKIINDYSPEKVQTQLENRLKMEQDALQSNQILQKMEIPKTKKPLPPELAVIFGDLKKSMLTNSKK